MIIGISGKKGAGKSTVAKAILREVGPERATIIDFAQVIKNMCMALFAAPVRSLWGSETDKNEQIPHLGMSGRQLMQSIGQGFRDLYPDVWVVAWRNQVESGQCHGRDLILASDVRYENEVKAIHEMGGKVIRLERTPFADLHESENNLNGFAKWDLVILEDVSEKETIDTVIDHVREWLER